MSLLVVDLNIGDRLVIHPGRSPWEGSTWVVTAIHRASNGDPEGVKVLLVDAPDMSNAADTVNIHTESWGDTTLHSHRAKHAITVPTFNSREEAESWLISMREML